MSTAAADRRLSRSALEEYLTLPAPAVITVPGSPTCHVIVDPPQRVIALRVLTTNPAVPDLTDFAHVATRRIFTDGQAWSELSVDYAGHPHEAYLLVGDVADMIQQDEVGFDAAVRSALSTFEALVARAGRLSTEQQTGLFGELLFLESCLHDGYDEAVEAWKGFTAHEHDFVLSTHCVEVKTTRGERRRHRISGLEQLQPVPGVPLWLVSVQLTPAAPGTGRTLGDLIDAVRALAGTARTALDAGLSEAGWRDQDRPLYRDRLRLRSVPAAYPVDEGFPVLDRGAVDATCARPELIIEATYTIDVTTLQRGPAPKPTAHFVMEGE